jgi:hypothetical protein
MSVWSIVVERAELESVCDVLGNLAPLETKGEGVWVRSINGKRVWAVESGSTHWEVDGIALDQPLEAKCLPGRALWDALVFVRTTTDVAVTFSIPDGIVCLVESEVGTSVIDMARELEFPQYPMYVADAASAKVTAGALFDLLYRARAIPVGPADEHYPDAQMYIENGTISIYADWSIRNGLRSTYKIPAETDGEASCAPMMIPIFEMIREFDRETELTIRIPVRSEIPLLIESENFRAAVECKTGGVNRHHDELLKVLSDINGFNCQVITLGKFTLDTYSQLINVELSDSPDETIRVYTEVCRNVPATLELLQQINESNCSLVGAGLWHANDVVWGGFDLPCSAMDELEKSLRSLDRQLVGYDVFLSGFSEVR